MSAKQKDVRFHFSAAIGVKTNARLEKLHMGKRSGYGVLNDTIEWALDYVLDEIEAKRIAPPEWARKRVTEKVA